MELFEMDLIQLNTALKINIEQQKQINAEHKRIEEEICKRIELVKEENRRA